MNRPIEILKTLTNHGVDFIVVGGFAATGTGANSDPANRTSQPAAINCWKPASGGWMCEARSERGKCTLIFCLTRKGFLLINPDLRVRVLELETQIAIKEETGRDKDLAVLPTLRATLAEIRRLKKA